MSHLARSQRRDVDALRQPVVTTPRSIQVAPGHLRELGVALDKQAAPPGQDRGHAGRTTARERVEHAAVAWHVDVQEVGHQLHRLRRRVPLRIANLWNLKNVRLMPEYWIGREHRGGNTPQRVRRVGCVAVEISPEHSPLGGVEGVGTAGLLAVTVATPGDACRIQVRHQL
jgi:hypothetical protein